jgi:hypothetical protein
MRDFWIDLHHARHAAPSMGVVTPRGAGQDPAAMSDRSMSSRSGGFTLVETLVAMILVSTVMFLLAPALFHVANERVTVEAATHREAALEGESNRLSSLPFAELDAQSGCTLWSDPFPHERCVVVNEVSKQEKQLLVTIVPLDAAVARDSLLMTRTDRRANPFNTGQP